MRELLIVAIVVLLVVGVWGVWCGIEWWREERDF
jgi:hypothetical protein